MTRIIEVAFTVLLLTLNCTFVVAASSTAANVIIPEVALIVTAVVLSDSCWTEPDPPWWIPFSAWAIDRWPEFTVTFCPSAPTVNPAVAVPPTYVFNCMSPSLLPDVSLPAVRIISPPAAFPDAVPAVKFKLPAAPEALLPLSIVKGWPTALDADAVGLIVGASVFKNLILPFTLRASAKTAAGVSSPTNTLPAESILIPSCVPV